MESKVNGVGAGIVTCFTIVLKCLRYRSAPKYLITWPKLEGKSEQPENSY